MSSSNAFTKIVFSIIFANILCGCDTIQVVRSETSWNTSTIDQACIRKAIYATQEVSFNYQEKTNTDRLCFGGCNTHVYTTYYTVLANKLYKDAFVQFVERYDGKVVVENYGTSSLHHSLSNEDRQGFEAAIASLNTQIKRYCPDAGLTKGP